MDREEVEVPIPFRDVGFEVPYTVEQLQPTIKRLKLALEADLGREFGTPQQKLGAAWTRIAELRLPRKAVPNRVLDEIEELVTHWDRAGHGGINAYAATLSDAQVLLERTRIENMLIDAEMASSLGYEVEYVPTD